MHKNYDLIWTFRFMVHVLSQYSNLHVSCVAFVCMCVCVYMCVSRGADAGVATGDSATCHSHPERNQRLSPEYQSKLSWDWTASVAVCSPGSTSRRKLKLDELQLWATQNICWIWREGGAASTYFMKVSGTKHFTLRVNYECPEIKMKEEERSWFVCAGHCSSVHFNTL